MADGGCSDWCAVTGVQLSWCSETQRVTCTHSLSGASLAVTHTGHLAFSSAAAAVQACTGAISHSAQRQREQQQQQQGWASMVETSPDADSVTETQHPAAAPGDGVAAAAAPLGGATANADLGGSEGSGAHAAASALVAACSQAECWGVLGLDMLSGEAAMFEAEGCLLHIAPGEIVRGCMLVSPWSPSLMNVHRHICGG